MILNLNNLYKHYDLKIKGIVHVGAHLCEELDQYLQYCDNENIIWIEGNPVLVARVRQKNANIKIYDALVSDVDDVDTTLHIANNGMSSSILEFGVHKIDHPGIRYVDNINRKTIRLDSFYTKHNIDPTFANFLALDIQGVELQAIKGLGTLLNNFDYIMTEVNKEFTYVGNSLVHEIDEYVKNFGFVRVETSWATRAWGDAFYIKSM